MDEPKEIESEAKKLDRGWLSFIASTVLIMLFYFASMGPVMLWIFPPGGRIHAATPTEKILKVAYAPWWWAYRHTPLGKPLDMYLKLWVSEESGSEE
jgi:hypothetical protein